MTTRDKTRWSDVTEAELAATGKVRRGSVSPAQPGAKLASGGTTLAPTRSKYRNVKTVVEGVGVFDSGKEAARWGELELLQKAGHIRRLRRQVHFSCDVTRSAFPQTVHLGDWIADFTYQEQPQVGAWIDIAEDSKGMKTPLYRWKKRHVEAQYGIQIRET